MLLFLVGVFAGVAAADVVAYYFPATFNGFITFIARQLQRSV